MGSSSIISSRLTAIVKGPGQCLCDSCNKADLLHFARTARQYVLTQTTVPLQEINDVVQEMLLYRLEHAGQSLVLRYVFWNASQRLYGAGSVQGQRRVVWQVECSEWVQTPRGERSRFALGLGATPSPEALLLALERVQEVQGRTRRQRHSPSPRTHAAYCRARRAQLRQAGRCTSHADRPVVLGQTRCAACLAHLRAQRAARKARQRTPAAAD